MDETKVLITGDARGLTAAAGIAQASVIQMNEEIVKQARVAAETSSRFEDLNEKVLHFGMHQRSESRWTGFLSTQIAGLGIASKGAAHELSGFAAAFAIGGGIGVAIEGLKFAVKTVNDFNKEGEEAAKKLREAYAEAFKEGEKGAGLVGGKLRELDDQVEELTEKTLPNFSAVLSVIGLGKSFKEQIEEIRELQAALREGREAGKGVRDADEANKLAKEHAKMLKEVEKLNDDAAIEEARQHTERLRSRASREAETAAKIVKLEHEKEEKLLEARRGADSNNVNDLRIRNELKLAIERDYEAKIVALKDAARAQEKARDLESVKGLLEFTKMEEAIVTKDVMGRDKLEEEASHKLLALWKEQADQRVKIQELLQKHADKEAVEAKRQMRELLGEAKRLGDAVGSVMKSLIEGNISLGKAVAEMSRVAVRAIIDMVIKMVEADAVAAAAEAAKSQAGIPIIGPFLMVGAAAAAGALVEGLLGSIPSAAVGARIPAGVNPIIQVHENERILTAAQTAAYESDGGGGGGDHYHFHATYIDAAGVRAFIASREFREGVRSAKRSGGWPGP